MVKTRHSCYRLVILDAAQRLILVDGGVFPEATVDLLPMDRRSSLENRRTALR